MEKQQVTLTLDRDVVEALEALEGDESLSAVVNDALRDATERAAHRAAMLRWLDELDAKYGAASAAEHAAADALLDELEGKATNYADAA